VICRGTRVYCGDCRAASAKREAKSWRSAARYARLSVTKGRRYRAALLRILERDGGRCGICHLAIDPTLKPPHPLGVTLDHITPLSAGGEDTYDNLWPAHFRCNVEKGDDLRYRRDSALFGAAS